jgi:hypothetical protein
MPSTYTLISSNVLGSSAASVTFSAIPSTYTDLVLRVSARTNKASTTTDLTVRVNGNTSAIYSRVRLRGSGSAASSNLDTNQTQIQNDQGLDGNNAASNTFSSNEIYIPNYLSSANKPASIFSIQEDNLSTAYITALACLIRDTNPITSILLYAESGVDFVSGSSFYLYGIKNS